MGKVISFGDGTVTVECKGTKVNLRPAVSGLKEGDYVVFSGGMAVDKLEKEEAESILGETE